MLSISEIASMKFHSFVTTFFLFSLDSVICDQIEYVYIYIHTYIHIYIYIYTYIHIYRYTDIHVYRRTIMNALQNALVESCRGN